MDPLSDVLSLLKPKSYAAGGFDAGGPWSIRFAAHDGVKCYAVAAGGCWLAVEGVPDPVRLEAGDCFLLPRGWPFRLASDLKLEPVEFSPRLIGRVGAIATWNGGGDCLVGGHFAFAGGHASVLLGALPPIVHIAKEADKAALRFSLDRLRQELVDPQPGGFLIAQDLAHMILVQALRLHLNTGPSGGVGWLFALADKRMAAAISAMHEDPAHRWTLAQIAARAGMSRSSFAEKFKAAVGASPMEYLIRWRMLLAADRLTNAGDSVSAVALALGYESESAFSTAFKRVMGSAPSRHARRGAAAPEGQAEADRRVA